ncbi:uncharacterized protein FTOL_02139 [Fusarium torulosum]|uniref:Uncharacterized protein n=1 Tax=Fusarium torulosum TaxID=33205 RepID=A0AAE8M1A4_9HYPO|nr:uncharacterized protein FTOL_02139 [Fusarium torulosum]
MEDMEDDSQQLDLTQWDYNDLDFRTPQLSGINSRGATSFTSLSPSPSGQRPRLPLLQLDDWDPDSAYDESPPTCIHYSIEWKLQLRKGRLSKLTNDTEQDRVLAPGAFWDTTLKDKVDRLLRQKTPRGKKLRIDISFICKEHQDSRVVQQQGGRGSATARQLAQRDQLLETQQAAGQPRVWKDVYDLMRCNGTLCPGSYCYVDEQRKHMGLNTSILTKMVEYAEQGNELRTCRDVPSYILDMIYEKERLDGERRAKRKAPSSESDRPIKIMNVLPSPYGHPTAEGYTPPSSNLGCI